MSEDSPTNICLSPAYKASPVKGDIIHVSVRYRTVCRSFVEEGLLFLLSRPQRLPGPEHIALERTSATMSKQLSLGRSSLARKTNGRSGGNNPSMINVVPS